MSCGRIICGIIVMLAAGVFVAQIVFSAHYLLKPVTCERSEFLTKLTLAGGCSGILSIVFLSCCCHGYAFGLKSSDPERSHGRQIFYRPKS